LNWKVFIKIDVMQANRRTSRTSSSYHREQLQVLW
jgi:hypothetical protein